MTRLLRIKAAVLIAVVAASLPAPRTAAAQPSDRRQISVSGTAEMRVVPDQIMFSIGIHSEGRDVGDIVQENDRRLTALLALLDKLGVPRSDVQTNQLAISPRYSYKDGERGKFLGFEIDRGVSVIVKDFSKIQALMTGALDVGVTSISQGQFSTSQLRVYRDKARTMAARAAREKAELLATELGVKVGKVLSIEEQTGRSYNPMVQNAMSRGGEGGGDDAEGGVSAGEIPISATVSVVFELQ